VKQPIQEKITNERSVYAAMQANDTKIRSQILQQQMQQIFLYLEHLPIIDLTEIIILDSKQLQLHDYLAMKPT
jgi:hypothetical protein